MNDNSNKSIATCPNRNDQKTHRQVTTRAGHAVADYADMHISGCILINVVYADMRIMHMLFPNSICKRVYQQIQAFVF